MHTVRPTSPWIPPLDPADYDDNQADAMSEVAGMGSTVNIFATLVRHPGLFRKWLPFGGKLLSGKLSGRDRELLILRVGWRCQAEYEWAQHVPLARAAGMTDIEIERIKHGPDKPGWEPFDELLLRAADELIDDSCIGDETWLGLSEHYDDRQLIEVTMVVGHYQLVSGTLNSLGVQLEEGVAGFDATAPLGAQGESDR